MKGFTRRAGRRVNAECAEDAERRKKEHRQELSVPQGGNTLGVGRT